MITRFAFAIIAALALTACGANTKDIGKVPALSPVSADAAYAPLGKEYAADRYPEQPKRYSTWNSGGEGLFTARRAMKHGDILTVEISIDDEASFDNKSDRKRTSAKSLGLAGKYGTTSASGNASVDGSLNSDTSFAGQGGTTRSETLDVSIAALVVDILPNGNLLIRGSQEVLVNAEKRVLTIAGIVRPSDIDPGNVIPYERIAEARISYGGKGRITEVQQPPYGQQALDMLLPI